MAKNEELIKLVGEIKFRYNLKQWQIAEQLGVSKQYLSDAVNGRYPFSDDLREKFSKKFNLVYTTPFDTSRVEEARQLLSNAVPTVTEYEYIGRNKNDGMFFVDDNGVMRLSVPHVPYAARAEFANLAEDLEPHLDSWSRESYVVDKKVRGRYLSFDVLGNSMDDGTRDCLQEGDKVLVRELEKEFWKDLRIGGHRFWVIVFDSSILIKEIIREDRSSGVIVCHSLNPSPEYHDFELNLDNVRSLYYVVRVKPRERSA